MTGADHTMTLIQYRDAHRDEYLRHAGGWCTKAKYDRLYPPESRYRAWYLAIEAAVKRGETIRREVCDDLYRRDAATWRHLIHDYGTDWLPAGYRNPDVRAATEVR